MKELFLSENFLKNSFLAPVSFLIISIQSVFVEILSERAIFVLSNDNLWNFLKTENQVMFGEQQ